MIDALEPYVRPVVVTLSRYPVPPGREGEVFRPVIVPDDPRHVGLRPLYRPGSPFVAQYAFASLSLHFRRLRPDVIHTEYPPWSPVFWQALLARRLFVPNAKIVLFAKKNTYRRHSGAAQAVKDALTRQGLRRMDLVMAASRMAADMYVRELQVPREKVEVVTAIGVDGDAFRAGTGGDRASDELVVGYCGRLEPEKGVTDLVDAVELARRRHGARVRLRVLGGGSLAEKLIERAATEDWLEVLPGVFSTEVPAFMRTLDLYVLAARVLPDHQEHDAHALLEAQVAGLPVIGTRSGIIPELLSDGLGLLIPPEDSAALARAIAGLATDVDRRAELARRGGEKAHREYLLEHVARTHAELYLRLATPWRAGAAERDPGDRQAAAGEEARGKHEVIPGP